MELREICRRFIGDRLLENIGDDDLLEVTENNISYIHSDILIPLKYVDLYKWYGYLRDLLESNVNLLSKIIFLNDMLKTTHFMYKWATYKINPKFKRNMYNVGIDKLHLVVETNLDIKPSDYALSIKFLS